MPEDYPSQETLRSFAVEYLKKWIGHFYLWMGDDPSGFDCSGLIIEVLKSVGILPHRGDWTADQLLKEIFIDHEVNRASAGCLVFWINSPGIATHVEMCVDTYHTIGASGGGSKTLTIADAIKHNAFVKMRPITYRGSNFVVCDPFKKKE